MIPLILIRASRLHQRPLELNSTRIDRATLFPFFSRDGQIDQVMIVDPESSRLLAFRPQDVRLRLPFWGTLRIDGPTTPVDDLTVDPLAPLWHYDPWWLLKDKRYDDQAVIPILKATNCAESFTDQQPSDVLFDLALNRLQKVRFPAPSESHEHKRFNEEMLPLREEVCADKPAPRGGWHLVPIWS